MCSKLGRATVRVLLIAGNILLSACGGGGDAGDSASASQPSQSPSPSRAVAQTDVEIASLIYADERTPAGFYEDTTVPVTGYVATSHLKNSDLVGGGSVSVHELCTDDWNQAMEWSETVAAAAPTYADLVATDSNTRFFEFGRVPRGQVGAYLRARIYKCEYLDRAGVNLQALEGVAGRLNRRPFTAADLRELSEYLWLFSTFNNFGHTVLKSSGGAGTTMSHTLHVATLTRAPGSGGCDRIDVIEWTHSANLQTGDLQRSRRTLWSFGARQVGSAAETCAL